MQLSDQRDIKAAPAVVWAAILDRDVLQAAVPGCESMTGSAADGFEAVVVQKVGPVKARFSGKVTLDQTDAPGGFSLKGEGSGGVAGFAKGGAVVTLEDRGTETLLRYEASADVGGKIAQLGSRLIAGTAKKLADQFFTTFAAEVTKAEQPSGTA